MINNDLVSTVKILPSELAQLYSEVLETIEKRRNLPGIEIEFYPYVGINSRIRIRNGNIFVRVSDILADAPLEVHRALAEILLRKLFRRRIPANVSQIYKDFIDRDEIRDRSQDSRRQRGRKVISTAQGSAYDLDEIFDFLNRVYFKNSISKPNLTWSKNKTYRILGHHDAVHETVVISKSLDDVFVPRYVVEFVVFHEMLHIKHPTKFSNGRRYNHTAAFRRDEKEFIFFDQAEEWVEENTHKLRRAARKKR